MVKQWIELQSGLTDGSAITWPPPQAAFLRMPEGNQVHVWAASLEVSESVRSLFEKTLSDDELARAARFHFEEHRNRYLAAHGWLRQLLAGYLGISAATVKFVDSPLGKPGLAPSVNAGGLHFNLTHSEGLALVAIARGRAVGIDLERVRPLNDAEEMVARFFSQRENAAFRRLPEEQKPLAFFNLWTRKEAWLKATGEGIGHLLNQVEVSFRPGEPAGLKSLPQGFENLSSWSIHHLIPGPGFVGALVVAGGGTEPECLCWDHQRIHFWR